MQTSPQIRMHPRSLPASAMFGSALFQAGGGWWKPVTDIAAAGPIAERIRNRVADVRVEGFGEPIQVTCSIGVATSDTLGVWGEHLIARADAAVHDAKRSDRNRVQIAGALPA